MNYSALFIEYPQIRKMNVKCVLTEEIFLTLKSIFIVSKRTVREAEVAVGASHAHSVLEVARQGEVLVVVADGLLVVAEAVVRVAKEVASLRLALDVIQFLAEHQVVLIEGHRGAELAAGAVAVAEVAEGAGLADTVLQLPGDVEVAVVVDQGHFMHVKSLVGHGQITVSAGLAASIVALFRYRQFLFVVLDGLLIVAHGAVRVTDVPEGPAHARPVVQLAADVEVGLV